MKTAARFSRRVTIIVALLGLALVPVLAQGSGGGQGRQFGPPPGRGPFGGGLAPGGLALERLVQQLDLTDAQKGQIQALVTQQRTTLKPTLDSLRQAQEALDGAIMQVPENDGLLQTQVTAVSMIQAQLELARAQTEARIFQLLTPDQQQKAQQWLAQMQQRIQQRMQQRSGRSGL